METTHFSILAKEYLHSEAATVCQQLQTEPDLAFMEQMDISLEPDRT